MKQSVRLLQDGGQGDLFEVERRAPGERSKRKCRVVFDDREPEQIWIGKVRLKEYLEQNGGGWVFIVREVLRELPWEGFMSAYKNGGRPPYHPASMVGLIIYGMIVGKSSLRQLERLARLDLGAIWVSGGIHPDHASIGRFMRFHESRITQEFFDEVTKEVIRRVGSKCNVVAGDGTVVEAAGSRFRMLRQEVAREKAREALERAKESPEDEGLKREAERAEKVARMADERVETRRRISNSKNRSGANAVCETDPEAPMIKGKRGTYAPSYQPSVLANEDRLIVAQEVVRSNECEALGPMLERCKRVVGGVETVLLDGYYCNGSVMKTAVEHNLAVLCPPRPVKQKKAGKVFSKADFRYDCEKDVYICPANQELRRRGKGNKGASSFVRYKAPYEKCKGCPLRGKCLTGSQQRRTIERYEMDEMREAMEIAFCHTRAAPLMKRRKVMIEPVFSELRYVQGLNRFRRFGLAGAKLEFALHAAAYNIRRMIALLARRARRSSSGGDSRGVYSFFLALLLLYYRIQGSSRTRAH